MISSRDYHVNNMVSKSSSRVGAVEKSKRPEACEFTSENILGCKTLCFVG